MTGPSPMYPAFAAPSAQAGPDDHTVPPVVEELTRDPLFSLPPVLHDQFR